MAAVAGSSYGRGGTGRRGPADGQEPRDRRRSLGFVPWIRIARKTDSKGYPKPPYGFQIESPLDHRRNYLEAWMCDAAIVLMGETGTLSELGSTLALRKPVVLVGEKWRLTDEGLRATPAQLATATNAKFGNAAVPALGYQPAAPASALQRADQLPAFEWHADDATAAANVDGALRARPDHVTLTGR